jgi:hypothetical protein
MTGTLQKTVDPTLENSSCSRKRGNKWETLSYRGVQRECTSIPILVRRNLAKLKLGNVCPTPCLRQELAKLKLGNSCPIPMLVSRRAYQVGSSEKVAHSLSH